MNTDFDLMMKCDMCYDRTSVGKKPMCATVCPSGALYFGTPEEIERLRASAAPIKEFVFGQQRIRTKVNMLVPRHRRDHHLDVTAAMHEPPTGADLLLNILVET